MDSSRKFQFLTMAEPIRVVITGAAGQIGYSLVYMIASGSVFGEDQVGRYDATNV